MQSTRVLRPTALDSLRQAAVHLGGAAASRRPYCIAAARRATAPVLRPEPAAPVLSRGIRRYSQQQQQQPESKIWGFEEVQELAKQPNPDVVIVDVREPAELQSTGHIPHAVNVPFTSAPDSFYITADEFEDRFGFVRPDKGQEVVFYCKAGVRSRAAAGLARDAGWTRVGEYPGSWIEWAGKGGDVER